jgi:serine protease AprX
LDGLQKPDLIAPAIWIPAPILPLTKAHEQAKLLFSLAQTQDSRYLKAKYINTAKQFGFESSLVFSNDEGIRQKLQTEIGQRKLITPDYQHADGTSFAAPIVSGIVAQMLEANPNLTPQKVKEVLGKTARTLPNVPSERQGAGVVHALNAVKAVKNVVQPKSPIFFF